MQAVSTLAGGLAAFKPITEEEARANALEERRKRFSVNMRQSQIPERYKFADLKTCDPEATEYAMQLARSTKRNLVLVGEAKTGKTYTACSILKRFMWDMDTNGIFVSMSQLLGEIKQAYGRSSDEDSVIFRYTCKPLLVIDDLGKERFTQWSVPILWRIIDRRYNTMRPTIITCQYSVEKLADALVKAGTDAEMIQAIIRRIVDPLEEGKPETEAKVIKTKAVDFNAC